MKLLLLILAIVLFAIAFIFALLELFVPAIPMVLVNLFFLGGMVPFAASFLPIP